MTRPAASPVIIPVCVEHEYPTFRALHPDPLPADFDTWLELRHREATTHTVEGHQVRLAFVDLTYLATIRPISHTTLHAHADQAPYRVFAGTVEGAIFVEECARMVNRQARSEHIDPEHYAGLAGQLLDTITAAIDIQALFTIAFFEPATNEPSRNVTVHLIRDETELVAAGNPTELDMLTAAAIMGLCFGGLAILRSRVETTELTDRVRAWELTRTGPNPLTAEAAERVVPTIGTERILFEDA